MSRRRIGLWTTAGFAAVSAVGMFVQVYLVAGVLFGEDWLELHTLHGALVPIVFATALGIAWRACKALEIGARTRRAGRNGGDYHDPARRPNRQRVLQ